MLAAILRSPPSVFHICSPSRRDSGASQKAPNPAKGMPGAKVKAWDPGSYHKGQISNPLTMLPPMFETAKFQIRQRRYQPDLTLPYVT